MSALVVLNDETFVDEILKNPLPSAVLFKTKTCSHCKKMLPIIEELAEEYAGRIKTAVLDMGEGRKKAVECGVLFVPQIIFFKDGAEAGSLRGAVPKQDVIEKMESLLA